MKTSYKNKKKKHSIKDFFPLFLFIIVSCMCIGYAQIGSIDLSIGGTAMAHEPEGIYISNVELISNTDVVYTQDYVQRTLITNIELDKDNPNSSVTYRITIKNNSNDIVYYDKIISETDNPDVGVNRYDNIVYDINNSQLNNATYINVGESIFFDITFHYLDSQLPTEDSANYVANYNILKSYITFEFNFPTYFAIYSETDNSLRFYKRKYNPIISEDGFEYFGTGENGELLKVTTIYSDTSGDTVKWSDSKSLAKLIVFEDEYAPTSVTNWFNSFSIVEKIDLEKLDTSNITYMAGMFRDNPKLKTIIFGDKFNTSHVSSMESMFQKCFSLENLDLRGFNTENVTSMRTMFYQCEKLTSLDLSGFDTSKVQTMYYMFTDCIELVDLNVSNFNTINVTTMQDTFGGCAKLTSLDLSSFDTSKVTNMTGMFEYSTLLSTIYVSDSFVINNNVTSNRMFTACKNLVGGAGTTYSGTYTNSTYARIDGKDGLPGYFTLKPALAN